MKIKNVLALLLAVIMVASMAVPVSADNQEATSGDPGTWEKQQTKVDGVVRAGTLIMSIPTQVTMVVNPYGLSVKLPDASPDATTSYTDDQIVMNNQYVINLSDVNVNVSMSVKGVLAQGKNLGFAQKPSGERAATAETSKFYHLWLETKPITGTTNGDLKDASNGKILSQSVGNWQEKYVAAASRPTNTHQAMLVTNNEAVPLNNVAVLAAADWKSVGATPGEASPAEASFGNIEPNVHGWLAFKMLGDVTNNVPAPGWTAADTVTVTVSYTFKLTGAKATLD